MKNQIIPTYQELYNQSITVLRNFISEGSYQRQGWDNLVKNPSFQSFMSLLPGIVGVLNLSTRKYEFVSSNVENIWGYPSKFFIESSFEETVRLFVPEQANAILGEIFPTMFSFFENYSKNGQADKLRVSYESIIQHLDGTKGWYLHQFTVIQTDENQRPTLLMKSVTDIQNIKKDNTQSFTISIVNEQGEYETIHSEIFFPQNEQLSLREMEILKLISSGESTKRIADRLSISEHTVSTHRKNMLKKLDAKSTHELVNMAVNQKII